MARTRSLEHTFVNRACIARTHLGHSMRKITVMIDWALAPASLGILVVLILLSLISLGAR